MSMTQSVAVAAVAAVTALGTTSAFGAITISTVPVGNAGNAPDTRVLDDGTTGYGSVPYTYNIGTYEVTNTQYVAFLNAVAATDTNQLYTSAMTAAGGITRSGSVGTYSYATITGRASHPVNFVSFLEAARFANWLHNGQPTGEQNAATTEAGTYAMATDNIDTITRNVGWQWAVASENEWYKAAYHQPADQGGDADDYWLYPNSRNTITTAEANYSDSFVLRDSIPVGSYAPNFYGTFDMGGNVSEWTESVIKGPEPEPERVLRGGSFDFSLFFVGADYRHRTLAYGRYHGSGFRVSHVPGQSSVALLAIGGVGAMTRRRGVCR